MTRDGDLALLEKALGGGDQARHSQRHLYERDILVALGTQEDEVVSAPASLALLETALGGGDQARHRQRHLYELDLLVALGHRKIMKLLARLPACLKAPMPDSILKGLVARCHSFYLFLH
jgi:hypothetical protein